MKFYTIFTVLSFQRFVLGQDGTCDFQQGLCGYTAVDGNNGRFKWNFMKSSSPTQNTGPFNDHNGFKSSYYLYTEASDPAQEGDSTTLKSPTISSNAGIPQCLTFWYNAFGEGMGELEVAMKVQRKKTSVFQSAGDKGIEWHKVSKTISSTEPFELHFTSTRGSSFTSDMAIDDISITQGECEEEETTNPGEVTGPPTKPPPVAAKDIEPRHVVGVERVGCYRDAHDRAFPEMKRMAFNKDPVSFLDRVIECRDIVAAKGEDYEWFGVEYYGVECFYGSKNNQRTKPFKHGQATNCVRNMMGAAWSFYLYYMCKDGERNCTAPPPPTPPPPPKGVQDLEGIEQVGCYGDTWNRAFPERINLPWRKDVPGMLENVKKCRDAVKSRGGKAAGYDYFAIEYWRECFFGKRTDRRTQPFRYGPRKCPNRITGEGWSMMVYKLLE